MARHPSEALYAGERPFPVLAPCDHYAGSEKLMKRALELQHARGGGFDVTFDLEDGAPEGRELEHAEMAALLVASPANALRRAGIRVHARTHPAWRREVEIVLSRAREAIAYLTIPKVTSAEDAREMIAHVREVERREELARETPIHVMIETHGAVREAFAIASIPSVEALDFGLMDFVSDHHGAISAACMRSPGQFEHALIRRAKAEVAAAAFAAGVVPVHNVTLELKDKQRTALDARRAKEELGFLRMWSIHPEQIEPIIEAMRPDHAEVEAAGAILVRAAAHDWAPIEHAGTLQDRATYRYYWEVLQRARAAGVRIDPGAEAAFFSAPAAR